MEESMGCSFFRLNESSVIYIVAPASYVSGGPELLHQLCATLVSCGKNAKMHYAKPGYKRDTIYENPVPDKLLKYKTDYARHISDESNNILIVPETMTYVLSQFQNIQKCIWWLSFSNYYMSCGLNEIQKNISIKTVGRRIVHCFKKDNMPLTIREIRNQKLTHFAQCNFIISKLSEFGILNVPFLSDYVSDEYLDIDELRLPDSSTRNNIVLYNPKRKNDVLKNLIGFSDNIAFIPIENMTIDEMKALMLRSKVFIDFGAHAGKDRLPREAALCGCCVITSTMGSAGFFQDLPIPSEYKYDRKNYDVNSLKRQIVNIMDNYDSENLRFTGYRSFIRQEKNRFLEDVKIIFQ